MKYNTTFWIKDTRRAKSVIICYVHGGGERWRFPVGHSIPPGHWSLAKQRVKAGNPLAAVVNDRLDRIAFDLATIIDTLQATGTINMEAIRERWELAKAKPPEALDFIGEYERWITAQPFTKGTKLNHGKTKNHVRKFAKARAITLTFEAWNPIVWRSFGDYLQKVVGLTNASTWGVLKNLKAFLGATFEAGQHANDSYRTITAKKMTPRGESDSSMAYLSESELATVTALDLSDNPRLGRVRDLFVFLCHTGIRFGDSQRLGHDHRYSDKDGEGLRFTTGKNRTSVNVPLIPVALRIWQMYEGMLPRISNQKANTYLKELLQLAGIDSPITSVRFRGVERLETTVPKHDAVGIHGAKRTFVTNALLRGVSLEALSLITGNTPATLRAYDMRDSVSAAGEYREAFRETAG